MNRKITIRRTSFILWLISCLLIVIFYIFESYTNIGTKLSGSIKEFFYIFDILFGIVVFLVFIASLTSTGTQPIPLKKIKTDKRHSALGTIFLTIIGTLIVVALAYFGIDYVNLKTKEDIVNPTPFPTHTTTPTPLPTVQKPVYVDPDPIIDCESSYPNCKGNFIRVRKSQCPNITCCGFTDGTWRIYASVDQCKKDQSASSAKPATQTTKKIQETFVPYSIDTDPCYTVPKQNDASCESSCKDQSDYDAAACKYAFAFGGPEQNNDKYAQCLKESGDIYGTCLNKCFDQYVQDTRVCQK